MNIRDYEYIIAIADQGGISKAASMLYITQSALTKFLQRTEAEVGTPLFNRKGNSFLLTKAGQYYVEKGREIMRLDKEISEELNTIRRTSERHLRIGFSAGRADYILQSVLPEFYKEFPDFRISAIGGSNDKQLRQLEEKELDMVLVAGENRSPNLTFMPVGTTRLVLAVHSDSSLCEKAVADAGCPYPVIRSEDFLPEPFIRLSMVTRSGSLAEEYFKRIGKIPHTVLDVNDVRSAVRAVEMGIGISIFWSIAKPSSQVSYLSIEDLAPQSSGLFLAYRNDFCITPPVTTLTHIIKETL